MRFGLLLAAVLLGAAAVLLSPWRAVHGAEGVRLLGDTDPHYHVLRAERMMRGAPGAPWRDPMLDSPNGADVPWPPLFDLALVAAGRLAGAGSRDALARASSIVPVLLGLLAIALVALAGRLLAGARAGLLAAAIASLLPAFVRYAALGHVDQHVAEILLATAVALAFARGLSRPRTGLAAAALGLAIALSFWTWMGSAVALLAPAATVALARALGEDEAAARGGRTLALGGGLAAALLASSIAAFGPPGALGRTGIAGTSGLPVAIVLGVAAFGAILSWRARRPARTPLRAAEPVAAAAVPAALLVLLWPGLAGGVARGLVPLAASNPWYADIREFGPALFAGLRPVTSEIALAGAALGLVPLAAALAVPASVRRRRADPRCRPPVLFLASWFAVTFALSLARIRFFPYFVAPCAIAAASGALWAGEALAARLGRPRISLPVTAVVVAASLAPAAAALPALAAGADGVPEPWIAATRWLREAGLPPDARRAVAAPWGLGHLVQYYGDRPVIASPFGTEAGPEALPDWTSFLFTGDPAAAEAVLLRRGVSHLVLQNPVHELVGLRGFAPPGARPLVATRSPWTGETVIPTPRLPQLVASRLYFGDGLGGDGSLEAFRLVYEGASTRPPHPLHEERIAIFELVAGATLRVAAAPPGVLVSARVGVVTNAGRSFTWSAHRIAGPTGAASFRVPYATGANGAARASACEVLAGASRTAVSIADRAVEEGAEIAVALGPWREVH